MNTPDKMKPFLQRIFFLCFMVYTITYIGRYNFSAAIPAMTLDGYDKNTLGLIGTGFFICYGLGQMVSGYLGDKIQPRHMIAVGLIGSAFINALMSVLPSYLLWIWCVNGLFQSMLWSPIARMLAEWLPLQQCKRAMVTISYTMATGALAAYGISALMLEMGSWKWVFLAAAVALSTMGMIWMLTVGKIEKAHAHERVVYKKIAEGNGGKSAPSLLSIVLSSGLWIVGLALMADGIIKDGVSMWIPTYLSEQFRVGAATSALASTLLPVLNLLGIFLADRLNRAIKSEVVTSSVLFGVGAIALFALRYTQGSMLLSLLLLGLTMMCTLGVNMMLLGIVPMYFVRFGKTSTISGMLNTCVHIASSVSSYGIAVISTAYGWNVTILTWVGVMAIGLVCALCVRRKFTDYVNSLDQIKA